MRVLSPAVATVRTTPEPMAVVLSAEPPLLPPDPAPADAALAQPLVPHRPPLPLPPRLSTTSTLSAGDWTLRDELSFTAPAPWAWLQPAQAADENAALAEYVAAAAAGAGGGGSSVGDATDLARAWYRARLYWAHPAQPPPPSYAQTMARVVDRRSRLGADALTAAEQRDVGYADRLVREWCAQQASERDGV
jgi:hypothetical protein